MALFESYKIVTDKDNNKTWLNFSHILGNRKIQDKFIIIKFILF